MKPKHKTTVERDAIFLAASRFPFTRWNEHTFEQRDKFLKEASRIRQHLATYEPLAFVD